LLPSNASKKITRFNRVMQEHLTVMVISLSWHAVRGGRPAQLHRVMVRSA
jgi:hypothetical protein